MFNFLNQQKMTVKTTVHWHKFQIITKDIITVITMTIKIVKDSKKVWESNLPRTKLLEIASKFDYELYLGPNAGPHIVKRLSAATPATLIEIFGTLKNETKQNSQIFLLIYLFKYLYLFKLYI